MLRCEVIAWQEKAEFFHCLPFLCERSLYYISYIGVTMECVVLGVLSLYIEYGGDRLRGEKLRVVLLPFEAMSVFFEALW